MTRKTISRITPLLSVEEIEPCLPFWEKLGFEKTVAVPESGKLDFAILQCGDSEVMYQTISSVAEDLGNNARSLGTNSCLYIDTDNIMKIEETLKDAEVVVPKRKTFYGATEIFYREPGGHVIGFAEKGA